MQWPKRDQHCRVTVERSTYIPGRVVGQTLAIDPRFPALLDGATLENDDQRRCEVTDYDDEDEVVDKSRNPTHIPNAIRAVEQSPVS